LPRSFSEELRRLVLVVDVRGAVLVLEVETAVVSVPSGAVADGATSDVLVETDVEVEADSSVPSPLHAQPNNATRRTAKAAECVAGRSLRTCLAENGQSSYTVVPP
jgi:hypothetical protein